MTMTMKPMALCALLSHAAALRRSHRRSETKMIAGVPAHNDHRAFDDSQNDPCVFGVRWAEEEATGINPTPCHCFSCYYGPDCSQENTSCSVDVKTAEIDMMRQWFEASSLVSHESAAYGMPYRSGDIQINHDALDRVDDLAKVIDERLRLLHDADDNVPGGTGAYNTIILGAGATQLLSAAIYAFSTLQGGQCVTTAQSPFWRPFKTKIVEIGSGTDWVGEKDETDGCSIEIVTTPNNPDNRHMKPMEWTKAHIYDLVYNWRAFGQPALTSKNQTVPVAIFSAGKIFGHAPSRLGWAFVRDPDVATHMFNYIWSNGRASSDAQYRHSLTLQLVLGAPRSNSFMTTMREELVIRYQQLAEVLARGNTFTIATDGWGSRQGFVPDAEMMKSLPTPCVVWIESPEGSVCSELMARRMIRVSRGASFSAPDKFCRLTVSAEQAVWDLVLKRLEG